jgi:hypothetical protein
VLAVASSVLSRGRLAVPWLDAGISTSIGSLVGVVGCGGGGRMKEGQCGVVRGIKGECTIGLGAVKRRGWREGKRKCGNGPNVRSE